MQALKVLILLIICCTANQLAAQTYFGKVKCDSFLVMQDTSRAIIYRKNKTTVFDKKQGKFRFKPTKDVIFYLGEQELLVQVAKSSIDFIYLNEDNEPISFTNNTPNPKIAEFPILSGGILDSIVRFNSVYFNYKNGTVPNDEITKDFWPVTTFSVERFSNNLLLINHVKIPTGLFDLEFEQYVMDDPGIAASGVYSLTARKWLVPAIYESVKIVDNNLICLKRDSIVPEFVSFNERFTQLDHSYDYYRLNNDVAELVQTNITENDEIDLASFLGVDSVENRSRELNILSNQYTTFKNGKQGLVEFQLFSEVDYDVMGYSNFKYAEIFPPKCDYILNDVKGRNIITLDRSLTEQLTLHRWTYDEDSDEINLDSIVSAKNELIYGMVGHAEERVSIDGQIFYWPELIKAPGFEIPHKEKKTIKHKSFPIGQKKSCGLQFFNDSLMHVLNFEYDEEDLSTIPYQSILFPYEDSIVMDEDGDLMAVYPAPNPGYEESGIYNLNTNKWFIERNYRMIHKRSNGILLEEVIRKEFNLYDTESYSLLQPDRTYTFQDVISRDKAMDPELYKKALFGENMPVTYYENPEKSIYRENYGYESGSYRYIGNYYSVVLESSDWQIQQPFHNDNYINLTPLTKPAEFVHYNPSYYYYFWLDQDSLYLEIGGSLYATERENGTIDLDIIELEDDEEWRIHLVSGEDTLIHTSYLFSEQRGTYTTASFHVEEDLLFINEPQHYDNITPNAIYLDGFWEEDLEGIYRFKEFETETSYICQLVDGVWKKVTPYYANIERIPFGYLVNTGYEKEIVDPENYTEEERPRRYLVLDKNFKAISYLDFYDFSDAIVHPFGIQLCSTKCFLVGNDGKMITTANWDEFIIEDGQIKAVRYIPMDEDEYWFMDGEQEIEEFKFYPLPKE
ncbi:MAG: hypothetical protein GQ574_24425 [Crocinitomix sp.]|nr:hypothetical protein [Crocinitomix sp.]